MEDRIPTPGQEGRVRITPEDGSAPYYAKISMADNPTNPGTALNKATLLQDSTEVELFGNANNRTVDQAFSGIAGRINLIMQDVASMMLTVQDSAGAGIPGVLIGGMLDADGEAVYTNAAGVATGYVSEGAVTLSISGYADIADYSEQIQAVKGETYAKTITVSTRDFWKVTSSGNVKFSENVDQLDASVVGGGGGAGGSVYNDSNRQGASGGAGAGGEVINQDNIPFLPNTSYPVQIGAGGTPGSTDFDEASNGTSGGSTTFMGLTARGGKPGTAATVGRVSASQVVTPGVGGTGYAPGYGSGANGVWGSFVGGSAIERNGSNGQNGPSAYKSLTETEPLGAGGGSGAASTDADSVGGTGGSVGGGNGGKGGYVTSSNSEDGTPGQDGTGSGGGSGASTEITGYARIGESARGGSGCVCLRMHLKSAA